MDFSSVLVSVILLANFKGFLTLDPLHVNCEHENICALRETNVTLKCFYSNINHTTGFWFSQKQKTNWRNKDEPEDLTLDSDYSGRVYQRITKRYSRLIISDLIEIDSGEYQLMFIMKDGVKHLSSVTVNLTVTVLQVKILQESTKQRLTCDPSCILTSRPWNIYWKKNGQYIRESKFGNFSLSPAAYSCFSGTDFKIYSAPLCVSNSSCWDVSYTSTRVCALVGSTVDIHSTYSHPTGYTVEKTYWHLPNNNYLDLREDHQFAGRVEFVGNTLRIKDVKMSDSGEYRFRIITNKTPYSGLPGVILTVTDTQVKNSPATVSERGKVILSCSTKCTLDNNISYSWYKNGNLVTDGVKLYNKLYLDSVNSEELQEYSCAVGDEPVETSASEHFNIFLIVFVVQIFIIAAIWVWFCLKKKILSEKTNKGQICRDSNILNVSCTSGVPPTEPVMSTE